ncbi:MAG: hypothetical protein Q7S48_03910 [bacterium]|nr:hypothetical protein [bacterium]
MIQYQYHPTLEEEHTMREESILAMVTGPVVEYGLGLMLFPIALLLLVGEKIFELFSWLKEIA